jgi:hypothetical protein
MLTQFVPVCILLSVPLLAQQGVLMQFSPQGRWLEFDSYLVTVCNQATAAQNFHSALVRNAAVSRGISPAGFSLIQRTLISRNRTSAPRILLSVTELAGWTLGLLTATNAIWKPSANWQKGLPIVAGGAIRVGTTMTKRHAPGEEKLPGDLLPTFVSLPTGPGACVEYTLLAVGG